MLKQLETFNLTYSDSFTTELFIQGLNNKIFGEAREKLIMNEEFQGTYNVGETSYPTTWLIGSNYFRLIKENLPKDRTSTHDGETALTTTLGNQRYNGRRREQNSSTPQHDRNHSPETNQRSKT